MKPFKNLALMFATVIFAWQVNAQSVKSTATQREGKINTESKSEIKKASMAPYADSTTEGKVVKTVTKAETKNVKTAAKTVAKQGTKAAEKAEVKRVKTTTNTTTKVARAEGKSARKADKKVADGRTKTGDKVFHGKKGPNGETVYVGSKGGFYYLDKKEKKVYIK